MRPVLLAIGWGGLALISLGLFALMFISLRFGWSRNDVLALWGVAIALAAFLLAVLASAFAVTAYAISSRAPKLIPRIEVPGCPPNDVVFRRGSPDGLPGTPLLTVDGSGSIEAHYSLFNESNWTASNVNIRLEFTDLTLPPSFEGGRWFSAVTDVDARAVIGIQYRLVGQIHGRLRFVPDNIKLIGLRLTGPHPAILFFALADGYRSSQRLEVTIRN